MQFQADILDVSVVRPQVLETTALGAAYLAGLAVGYWKDSAEIAKQWQVDRVFEPSMPQAQREDLVAGWQKALGRAKAWGNGERVWISLLGEFRSVLSVFPLSLDGRGLG